MLGFQRPRAGQKKDTLVKEMKESNYKSLFLSLIIQYFSFSFLFYIFLIVFINSRLNIYTVFVNNYIKVITTRSVL